MINQLFKEIDGHHIAHHTKLIDINVRNKELFVSDSLEKSLESDWLNGQGATRNKERKISEVIDKLREWRSLYKYHSSFSDQNGNLVRMSLYDAAKKVGVSKKSLDDYLL